MKNNKEFTRDFTPKTVAALRSVKPIYPHQLDLPIKPLLHYISDTTAEYGVRKSHILLTNVKHPVKIHHTLESITKYGSPRKRSVNTKGVLNKYFKNNPSNFTHAKLILKHLHETRSFLVEDYSLLRHLYKYPKSKQSYFDEYFNIEYTRWDKLKEIGGERNQFISYNIPEVLPEYALLRKIPFPVEYVKIKSLNDTDALGLLFIWQHLVHGERLSEETAKHVFIMFRDSSNLIMLNLYSLYTWMDDDPKATIKALYESWNTLYETRTGLADEAVKGVELASKLPDVIGASNLENSIEELVVAGRLSRAEQQRLWKISEKYKTIPSPTGKGTLSELIDVDHESLDIDDVNITVKDSMGIIDKSMLQDTMAPIQKRYVEEVMEADIASMCVNMQNAGVIIRDYKVTEVKDALNNYKQYSVAIAPINGEVSTIKFKLPVVGTNGEFTANGVKYRMDMQRGDLPIRKVSSEKVALTSYYGKTFVLRSPKVVSNLDKWIIIKITKANMDVKDKNITNVTFTSNPLIKETVMPRIYSAISKNISTLDIRGKSFIFNYDLRITTWPGKDREAVEKASKSIAVSSMGKGSYIVIDDDSILHEANSKGITKRLGHLSTYINRDWGLGPVEHTVINIYGKAIPIGIVLSYFNGLDNLVKELDVDHRWVKAGSALNLSLTEVRVQFKDESLIYDSNDRLASLLLGGFVGFKRAVKEMAAGDFNNKNTYGQLFSLMSIGTHVLKEMVTMEKLFIDPITLEILKARNEPTDFKGLLMHSSKLLLDDFYVDEMDSRYMRFKGYERISGMVYKRLVDAVREQRNTENPARNKITLADNAVWNDVISDTSLNIVDEINPVHNLKEKEGFTVTGQGGREAVTMVGSARTVNKYDIGIISEASPDSGKVGIKSYFTPNARFNNIRGTTNTSDVKTAPNSSLISVTSLLLPASTNTDPKRANMASVQISSLSPAKGAQLTPVRTGYEQVIASRSDERFAYIAKGDGKVLSNNGKHLKIEYKDDNSKIVKEGVPLGIEHGTTPDSVSVRDKVTDLEKGNKFSKGDCLVWDSNFFARDILRPGGVSLLGAVMGRVVYIENNDTNEDGSAISSKLADKLTTKINKVKTLLVTFDERVTKLVKPGDVLDLDSILAIIEDESIAGSVNGDNALLGLSKLTNKAPKAKFKGTVTKIEIIYMGELKDMTSSLRTLATVDSKRRKLENKETGGNEAETGSVSQPTFINKSKIINNTMAITIYLTADAEAGVGDKAVYDNALKSVIGRVLTGEHSTEDGQELDAIFGYKSVSNRIVASANIVGTANSALIALTNMVIKAYR